MKPSLTSQLFARRCTDPLPVEYGVGDYSTNICSAHEICNNMTMDQGSKLVFSFSEIRLVVHNIIDLSQL